MIQVIKRRLNIPSADRIVGYAGDNLVEIRTFEVARMYGDVDLADFDFKLDTEVGGVKNIINLEKTVTDDKIILTWTIYASHVLHTGRMAVQIRAFRGEVEKWHSEQDYVLVQPSINATEAQPSPLPSEFEEYEIRITELKNATDANAQTALQQANRAETIADTFENETLPAAITAVEAAVEEQVDIAASHADRAQGIADTFSNTTLPVAISAVEAAGQAKVDLAKQEADRAKAQADIAETKAGEAYNYAGEAYQYKEAAGESATAAAGSAQTALQQANRAQGIADTFENVTLPASISAVEAAGQAKVTLAEQQAGIAAGHAQTATEKAGEASGYADDAFEYKEAAETAATTATSKAGQAVEYAGYAEGYAQDAYNDAERAMTALTEIEGQKHLAIRTAEKPKEPAGHNKRISGYGPLSIPSNANGQVSDIVLKGRTISPVYNNPCEATKAFNSIGLDAATLDNTDKIQGDNSVKITATSSGHGRVIKNHTLRSSLYYLVTFYYKIIAGTLEFSVYDNVNAQFIRAKTNLTAQSWTRVGYKVTPSADTSDARLQFKQAGDTDLEVNIDAINIIEITADEYNNTSINDLKAKNNYVNGTKSTNSVRIRSVNEDETKESIVNVNLPEPLRSLPNGVKDEVNLTTGVKTQRISEDIVVSDTVYDTLDTSTYTNVDVVITTAFADAKAGTTGADGQTHYYNKDGVELMEVAQADIDLEASVGKYYWGEDKKLYIIVAKGDYADIAAARTGLDVMSLNYQLAEPIKTPIDVIGELRAYPNGTVWAEPAIAGFMTEQTKVVTTEEYPISEVRKVIRYDISATGHLVETDVTSDVTIGDNNTSLTIANFEQGKTYFYDCSYPAELTTQPEVTLDVVVENGIISHDYAAAAADWVLDANEGKATMLICTNAGGTAKIVAPATDGKMYVVRNTSGQTITIKTASSTGVAIDNSKTATVMYTGTDYIKLSEV